MCSKSKKNQKQTFIGLKIAGFFKGDFEGDRISKAFLQDFIGKNTVG